MTDIGDLFAAIKTTWNAASLTTYITGGIHTIYKGSGSVPHCVVGLISDVAQERARTGDTRHRWDEATLQFSIFCNTGLKATATLAKRVIQAFENATLTITGATCCRCRFRSQDYIPDEEWPNGIEWVIVFDVLTTE